MVVDGAHLELETRVIVLAQRPELRVLVLVHGRLQLAICHLCLLILLDFRLVGNVLEDVVGEDGFDGVPVQAATAHLSDAAREEVRRLLNDEKDEEDADSD